ncbi:MAG: UMP kinase [Treponema sp.]|nr:UMP kinase [Treponema sp.]MCR5622420.1 UMP kinase [Treponema sp.]
MQTKVLSVGGSIIAPDGPDTEFLEGFSRMIIDWLNGNPETRLILVAGGGGPARIYQKAFRELEGKLHDVAGKKLYDSEAEMNAAADWIGIMATRINAQLLKATFGSLCCQSIVIDPTKVTDFTDRILVAAGWKPGFSSDNDAVLLAERFNASTVVNLSNIEKVYTDDPRTNPDAKPLDSISWADFRKMVGDEWKPGKNCPFDPIASKKAESMGLTVICASGHDIKNIRAILDGNEYVGTTIK